MYIQNTCDIEEEVLHQIFSLLGPGPCLRHGAVPWNRARALIDKNP